MSDTDTQAQTPLRLPTLYSFRRCPYAIRARMAIKYSGIRVALREVMLSRKPESMLAISPKGTVPVLVLPDGQVIDESRDIIFWALAMNDPDQWFPSNNEDAKNVVDQLLDENDFSFKTYLDKYKYHERYPEHSMELYRTKGEAFLEQLEGRLLSTQYLLSDRISVADIAIFPFVRQFAHINKNWFYQTSYINLQAWLDRFLQSHLFSEIMHKYPPWEEGMHATEFP